MTEVRKKKVHKSTGNTGKNTQVRRSTGSNGKRKPKRHLRGFGKKGMIFWKKFAVVALSVLLLTLIVGLFINKPAVNIRIKGDNPVTVEAGTVYNDEGATAKKQGSFFRIFGTDLEVQTTSDVNASVPGTYTVEYTASCDDMSAMKTRTVIVKDTTAPELTLKEDENAYTLPGHAFEEIGYTAIDTVDGDVTDKVTSEEKDGKVYYTVTDAAGNTAKAERKIVYDDRKGPEITLEGGDDVVWYTENGDYVDQYTAVDDLDGDVTSQVVVSGTVGTDTGDYTVTYTVSDSYGNESTATRTVHVSPVPQNNSAGEEDEKTIYLTFDDGPGPYTDELLDILAKYNVKATFFTTSCYGYTECIAREAKEGHTVAVHTYTHDYAYVYSSTDAYWEDFNAQNAVVAEQTGSYTTLFRFPGGSSNTVSANYCDGIVSALVEQAAAKGYEYFDWNVSSGDAGGTTDTATVYENVISQIEANSAYGNPSVVLQHDIKDFSVAAVEDIIKWGLENGYSFKPLSPGSYHARHSVAN